MKIVSVVGARPNFVKIAPLLRNFKIHSDRIQSVLVHTGQHYDEAMSNSFFNSLGIPEPDVNLGVGSASNSTQTARIMMGFEPVLEEHRPDWLLTVGDVNSTLACTLVASQMNIPAIHVEAGLRSNDRTMPEEINRIVTDALSDLLFPPSQGAKENLIREGKPAENIHVVGNIMIDSLVAKLDEIKSISLISSLDVTAHQYLYLTIHRPSNVDELKKLKMLVDRIKKLSQDFKIVIPLHPRTKSRLESYSLLDQLTAEPNIKILPPVSYMESLHLTMNAAVVVTDSGGIQEETTYLRVPCLTLRDNTERPETITIGSNQLTRVESLIEDVEKIMNCKQTKGSIPDLWDGKTAERITEIILKS
jgi:UDP-N-acetylglucosamine 2-epimerase (non-hydrolysing)